MVLACNEVACKGAVHNGRLAVYHVHWRHAALRLHVPSETRENTAYMAHTSSMKLFKLVTRERAGGYGAFSMDMYLRYSCTALGREHMHASAG